MKQTAYVVGGAGFLGTHLVAQLVAEDWEVVVIDPGATVPSSDARVTIVPAPISDEVLASTRAIPSHVFHLGGSGSVSMAEADPVLDRQRTVASTQTIARHFAGSSTRVVFVSSAAVYGECGASPIAETQPLNAISTYGRHKALAEAQLAEQARTSALSYAVVRFFSLYGPGLRKQLLWDACNKLRAGDATFGGTGRELRDWLHVRDAVSLLLAVARADVPALIVNGASGIPHSVELVIAKLGARLEVARDVRFSGQGRGGDPHDLVAEVARAKTLGFAPTVSLDDGLREYVRWFKTC